MLAVGWSQHLLDKLCMSHLFMLVFSLRIAQHKRIQSHWSYSYTAIFEYSVCVGGLALRLNPLSPPSTLQVHPNHLRPSHLKLKHYEFAGRVVGKCLFESAMGNAMLVKARFTRSFLAQIIGLRIHHKVHTKCHISLPCRLTSGVATWPCLARNDCSEAFLWASLFSCISQMHGLHKDRVYPT